MIRVLTATVLAGLVAFPAMAQDAVRATRADGAVLRGLDKIDGALTDFRHIVKRTPGHNLNEIASQEPLGRDLDRAVIRDLNATSHRDRCIGSVGIGVQLQPGNRSDLDARQADVRSDGNALGRSKAGREIIAASVGRKA